MHLGQAQHLSDVNGGLAQPVHELFALGSSCALRLRLQPHPLLGGFFTRAPSSLTRIHYERPRHGLKDRVRPVFGPCPSRAAEHAMTGLGTPVAQE